MTEPKREPFAVCVKHPTLDTWIVADSKGNNLCWSDARQEWDEWDAECRANAINAAFNARVDEEIKKAVEEFRERAIVAIESEEGEDVAYNMGVFESVNAIRALPTEPEANG